MSPCQEAKSFWPTGGFLRRETQILTVILAILFILLLGSGAALAQGAEEWPPFGFIYYPGVTYLVNPIPLTPNTTVTVNIYSEGNYNIAPPEFSVVRTTDEVGRFWAELEVIAGDVVEIIVGDKATTITVESISAGLDLENRTVEGTTTAGRDINLLVGDPENPDFTEVVVADADGRFSYTFPEGVSLEIPIEIWVSISNQQGIMFAVFLVVVFSDVLPDDWFYPPVLFLSDPDFGLIEGYPDRTFRPQKEVTRAEFVKMLITATQELVSTDTPSSFKDVAQDHWALRYIETARQRGIIGGYPDGTFRPNQPVTRAEIAKMVVMASGLAVAPSYERVFSDVVESHWAALYILTIYKSGIVSGYPDGTFRPSNRATRAEAAKIIFEMLWLED
jgi:hypothetical protein